MIGGPEWQLVLGIALALGIAATFPTRGGLGSAGSKPGSTRRS